MIYMPYPHLESETYKRNIALQLLTDVITLAQSFLFNCRNVVTQWSITHHHWGRIIPRNNFGNSGFISRRNPLNLASKKVASPPRQAAWTVIKIFCHISMLQIVTAFWLHYNSRQFTARTHSCAPKRLPWQWYVIATCTMQIIASSWARTGKIVWCNWDVSSVTN